jgi:hypothetical protein
MMIFVRRDDLRFAVSTPPKRRGNKRRDNQDSAAAGGLPWKRHEAPRQSCRLSRFLKHIQLPPAARRSVNLLLRRGD